MQQSFNQGKRQNRRIRIRRNLSPSPSQSGTSDNSDNDDYKDAKDHEKESEESIRPINSRTNYRINYGKPLQALQKNYRNNAERSSSQRQQS